MSEELPPNFTYVKGPFYVVRTQAGFRQALKHWDSEASHEKLEGYPTAYPSLVSFSSGYRGYIYVRADCIHVNELTEALIPHLQQPVRITVKFKMNRGGNAELNHHPVVLPATIQAIFDYLMEQQTYGLTSVEQLRVVPEKDQRAVNILGSWPYVVRMTVAGIRDYRVGYTDGPVQEKS